MAAPRVRELAGRKPRASGERELHNSNSVFSGLSSDNQNDLIKSIAQVIRDEIKSEINFAKFVSVIADETPDISHREQMSVIFRYLTKTGIEEKFVVCRIQALFMNLSDEFRDARQSTAVNNKNIDAVYRMIKTNRHVLCQEIRASLGINSDDDEDYICDDSDSVQEDESDCYSTYEENNKLRSTLSEWAVEHNIPHKFSLRPTYNKDTSYCFGPLPVTPPSRHRVYFSSSYHIAAPALALVLRVVHLRSHTHSSPQFTSPPAVASARCAGMPVFKDNNLNILKTFCKKNAGDFRQREEVFAIPDLEKRFQSSQRPAKCLKSSFSLFVKLPASALCSKFKRRPPTESSGSFQYPVCERDRERITGSGRGYGDPFAFTSYSHPSLEGYELVTATCRSQITGLYRWSKLSQASSAGRGELSSRRPSALRLVLYPNKGVRSFIRSLLSTFSDS
ncbi:hypothetical protein EVAR_5112_1 [Eumeta japonica]|uniref:Uncharacterized protein n=1 Tax=Eumeta variegata TaxID=151549 RepID=A0A4C1SV41_EUMVA|nr:hypothetical protein EVAR_5112_1 [Eumeta japonica]